MKLDADYLKRFQMNIENAGRARLDQVLDDIFDILDGEHFPETLLPIFIEAFQKDPSYVKASTLTNIIGGTGSQELYKLCMERNLFHDREFAQLFHVGFPDSSIEGRLANKLWKIFKKDDAPLRREIVKAMAAHGGKTSLNLLEQVHLELSDSIPVRQYELGKEPHADTPDEVAAKLPNTFPLKSAKSFYTDVCSAINEIKRRLEMVQ